MTTAAPHARALLANPHHGANRGNGTVPFEIWLNFLGRVGVLLVLCMLWLNLVAPTSNTFNHQLVPCQNA